MSGRDTRVSVYWWDASTNSDLVGTKEELKHMSGIAINTEGWLIKYDNDGIRVATERLKDEDGVRYRGMTYIPCDMIRGVWLVEKVKLLREK